MIAKTGTQHFGPHMTHHRTNIKYKTYRTTNKIINLGWFRSPSLPNKSLIRYKGHNENDDGFAHRTYASCCIVPIARIEPFLRPIKIGEIHELEKKCLNKVKIIFSFAIIAFSPMLSS